ncbi:Iaa7p [Sarracenia purpurea var. burkii]
MEVDRKMSNLLIQERDHGYSLKLKATELCLGLPGGGGAKVVDEVNITGKRWFSETIDLKLNLQPNESVVLKENMNSSQKNLRPCPKDPAKPRARSVVDLSACGATELTALLGRDGYSGRRVGPTSLASQPDGTDCSFGVSTISPKLPYLVCESDISRLAGLLKPISLDDLVDLHWLISLMVP